MRGSRGFFLVRTKRSWRRATFPRGLPRSILAAGTFHGRVRDGNAWDHAALPPRLSKVLALADKPSENCKVIRIRTNQTGFINETQLWSSPRPISTARLHTLLHFHLRPINHVFYMGSYLVDPVGELIFRWASNLDAFSFYPLRTQLPGMCRWRDNPYTGGPSVSVLSY